MYFQTIAIWIFVCCCFFNPNYFSRGLDRVTWIKTQGIPGNLTQCHLDSQVKVADWMKGQTCGLCGKADGEVRQEFRTPNGQLTKDTVSYAHSWVIPAENCQDTSGKKKNRLDSTLASAPRNKIGI